MNAKMPIPLKKIILLFLFPLPLFFACGPNNNDNHFKNGNSTGTYQACLIFPSKIPSIEPYGTSVSKLINGGINCAEVGIATLTFSFFSSNNAPIANGTFPCKDHQAVITDIPAGSGITLEVTAEDQSGMALLRGEEREITIVTNQTTQGDDITLYPAGSPSVTVGSEPKTLVFDWEHIRFPGHADHYQLQVDADGDSGFTPVEDEGASHIEGTDITITIQVHLTDWINAVYRVAALDAADNVTATSSEIDLLTTVSSEEVIGYIKADNTDAQDWFGGAVALSADGNTLVVGARGEDAGTGIDGDGADNSVDRAGAVYLFTRINGTWQQQAYIKAGRTDAFDRFGEAVALSAHGNTLAVGMTGESSASTGTSFNGSGSEDNSMPGAGAVYVYTRISGTWQQQAYVKAGNTDSGDSFGSAVALSANGNILAVGATGEDSAAVGIGGDGNDNSMADAGAVYVYYRDSGGIWQLPTYVKAGNTDAGDSFGHAVTLSSDGNTLAVGASNEASAARGIDGDENDNSMPGTGAVYLFRYSNRTWQQQAYIKAGNTDEEDYFGQGVALSSDGNTLAVGAGGEDSAATGINGNGSDNSMPGAGAVYLFTRSSGSWQQQSYVKAGNTDADDSFGHTVALSSDGNTLAVGSTGEDSAARGIGGDENNNNMSDAGTAYVFRHSGGNWRQQSYVKTGNTDYDDRFGGAVALSFDGNTLAVGAQGEASAATGINGNEEDNSMENAGAVYLY
jgi:hypothetical protein